MPLQVRRGTTAERNTITPLVGELVYDTQEGKLYVGDGTTVGGVPASAFSDDDAQDAVFAALNHSDHSGISFAYNDVAAKITATVDQDLSNYDGVISASGFKGSIFADDSTLIFNSTTGTITAQLQGNFKGSVFADDSTLLIDGILAAFNLDGTIKTNVIPALNETYDLGSSGSRFKDLYLSGTSIFLGNAQITASGAAVSLPAGSTVGGVPIASTDSGVTPGMDYNINIVGDDSSSIINANQRTVSAAGGFFGNLQGNVLGTVTGTLIGNVTGNITSTGSSSFTSISVTGGTINGASIGNGTPSTIVGTYITATNKFVGLLEGTSKASVFAEDSTLLVNTQDGFIPASVVQGTFTGNVSGNVTGNITSTGSSSFTSISVTGGTINGASIGNSTPSTITGTIVTATNKFVGLLEGTSKASVFAEDSTLLVNTQDGFIPASVVQGTFTGNVSGNVTGNITSTGSSSFTSISVTGGNINGASIGNGTPSTIVGTIITATNVFQGTLNGNVNGELRGSVFGEDSSILVDAFTGTFNGNLVGSVSGNLSGNSFGYHFGDMSGSVFAFDSTCLVDSNTRTLNATTITTSAMTLNSNRITVPGGTNTVIFGDQDTPTKINIKPDSTLNGIAISADYTENDANGVVIELTKVRDGDTTPLANQSGDLLGLVAFGGYDGTNYEAVAAISGEITGAVSAGVIPGSMKILVGRLTNDFANAKAYSFNHLGVLSLPGALQTVVYANPTARDAAVTAAAGMVVFVTDSTGSGGAAKLQCYDGSTWQNLF